MEKQIELLEEKCAQFCREGENVCSIVLIVGELGAVRIRFTFPENYPSEVVQIEVVNYEEHRTLQAAIAKRLKRYKGRDNMVQGMICWLINNLAPFLETKEEFALEEKEKEEEANEKVEEEEEFIIFDPYLQTEYAAEAVEQEYVPSCSKVAGGFTLGDFVEEKQAVSNEVVFSLGGGVMTRANNQRNNGNNKNRKRNSNKKKGKARRKKQVGILYEPPRAEPTEKQASSEQPQASSLEPSSSTGQTQTLDEEEDNEELELDTPQRGTELDFHELLLEGIGVVQMTRLVLVVSCVRCKTHSEITITATAMRNICPKCRTVQSARLRATLMHEQSFVAGYLDLEGCSAFDTLQFACKVDCLQCSHQNRLRNIRMPATRSTNCRQCNTRLSLHAELLSFSRMQRGPLSFNHLPRLPKPRKRTDKDPLILRLGAPLAKNGACSHFRRSWRWFRFPCCNRAYPCPICHDNDQDHEEEEAHRMICGFCSKEQRLQTQCTNCGKSTAPGGTSHWEGGSGCRDKSKLSRKDAQKYKNTDAKTQSRRSQRANRK